MAQPIGVYVRPDEYQTDDIKFVFEMADGTEIRVPLPVYLDPNLPVGTYEIEYSDETRTRYEWPTGED